MIDLRVKTIFKGMVAIRDRYLKDAKWKEEGICIKVGQQSMTIPFERIDRYRSISKYGFIDKFSKKRHKLVYYAWKPDESRQMSLEDLARLGAFG